MLRSERKMDAKKVKEFLIEAKVGRLGLSQNNEAYVVPVIYIYDPTNGMIYIHCAKKGRKTDMIKSNPKACFEVDESSGLVTGSSPCENDQIYRSVIAFGEANFLHDPSRKAEVLNMIVEKYAYSERKNRASVTPEKAEGTQIIAIKVLSKSGKENKGKTIPYQ
ncbi:MAG: pyridoxamine 5'-phosphate oxidase family protein [Nitrososphaeria archaeon]